MKKFHILLAKNIIAAMIFIIIFLSTGNIYAHQHHHDGNNDSSKISTVMQQEMAEHQQMEAVTAFPNYHPLIVHFPIVLLLMAMMFQLISFFCFKKEFGWTTLILLVLGVFSTWLASNTLHAMPGELTGVAKEVFEVHERTAAYTWWLALFALLAKTASQFIFNRRLLPEVAVSLLLLGSAITVSIAGHHGAMLVYMQGIGPQGKYLDEYRLPPNVSGSSMKNMTIQKPDTLKNETKPEEQESDHHVGEVGKGPHGGTIEEAEPNHIEIVADGSDLVFYLLDGDAKPLDMKDVTGKVQMKYADNSTKKINLMEIDGKLTAMQANSGQAFTATCTLSVDKKSYSAIFSRTKDLGR